MLLALVLFGLVTVGFVVPCLIHVAVTAPAAVKLARSLPKVRLTALVDLGCGACFLGQRGLRLAKACLPWPAARLPGLRSSSARSAGLRSSRCGRASLSLSWYRAHIPDRCSYITGIQHISPSQSGTSRRTGSGRPALRPTSAQADQRSGRRALRTTSAQAGERSGRP